MLIIRARIHKLLVSIANTRDLIRLLLLEQSVLGLHCLSRLFCGETSVRNFRIFTVILFSAVLDFQLPFLDYYTHIGLPMESKSYDDIYMFMSIYSVDIKTHIELFHDLTGKH